MTLSEIKERIDWLTSKYIHTDHRAEIIERTEYLIERLESAEGVLRDYYDGHHYDGDAKALEE